MVRTIIKIDEKLCNGCGICAEACHEGAIGMVNGKATLLRDDYCDGLGHCLPSCPTGAISFEEREAAAYDHAAVMANMQKAGKPLGGCPGSGARALTREPAPAVSEESLSAAPSRLSGWPVQIKLVPINAPYFKDADLLVSADCAAYAHAGFHENFMKNRVTLIGCPKLDDADYSEKLTEIIKHNDIKSVTAVRMEVPCCGGIEHAVTKALQNSGKTIPWRVVTLSLEGEILKGF